MTDQRLLDYSIIRIITFSKSANKHWTSIIVPKYKTTWSKTTCKMPSKQ